MKFLVYIETDSGDAIASSWEALGAALGLSSDVEAVVIGDKISVAVEETVKRGAQKVYVVEDETRALFDLERHLADVKNVLAMSGADAFLASHTINARDLAAALGADTGAGIIADALELSVDGDKLKGVRGIYSGNVLVDVTVDGAPQIATLRPRAFAPAEKVEGANAEVSLMDPADVDSPYEVLGVQRAEKGEVSLTEASIIVSGGRGVAKDPELGFDLIRELAGLLGAAVGASRAAVDAGFISYDHQVGQTGKVVRPDLYIACGISGAVQHLAGMGSSKIIVAVNKDEEAPIFSVANYGIVGDLFQVVPAISEAVREKVGK
jgi:electron transfer flavoprotein alpha subunit